MKQMLKTRKENVRHLAKAMAQLQKQAKERGLDKLSMREINEIIAEVRREHDPLYGQTRRMSVTLSERMFRQLQAAAQAQAGGSIGGIVRQAIHQYLTGTAKGRPKVTKAIAQSTEKLKTGRYEA
jgi:hypothetical protein